MAAHRSSSHHRVCLAATLAALALTAGCGSSRDAGRVDSGTTPSSAAATGEPTAEEPATEAATIDGTWSTPTLDRVAFRRALARRGLATHADAFTSELGPTVDLTLEVGSGFWTLYSGVDGGALAVTDRGTYEVEGQRVTVRPHSGGENVFRWRLVNDALSLTLVSTTEPPYEGVPAEVYQAGFYSTSTFARDAS